MKRGEKGLLILCALAPIVGFIPAGIHYALMRSLDFGGLTKRPEITTVQALGASTRLLTIMQDWLSVSMAIAFGLGALRLRHLIRNHSEVTSFPLVISLFFAGGISHFIIPHLIPFFFGIVMLAVIANIHLVWSERKVEILKRQASAGR